MAWRDLYAYWQAKHRDGRPPSRADVDPVFEIPRLLPNLFLLDVVDETFRFRLVGSEIVQRAGRDSTGRPIDRNLLGEQALASWLRILRTVADGQKPCLYCFDRQARTTRNALGILMPLVCAEDRTEMLMGGLFFEAARDLIRPKIPDRVYELPLPADGILIGQA